MHPLLQDQYKSTTERKYAERLEILKRAGEIVDYRYEGVKFKLGNGAVYTPDFLVVFDDHFEIHEVKGRWMEAARVRIKVAATQYQWFKFIAIQLKRGEWIIETFTP